MQEEQTVKVGRKHQTVGSFTSPAKTLVKCKAPTPAPPAPTAHVVPTTHIDYLKAWASRNTDTILQIPMDKKYWAMNAYYSIILLNNLKKFLRMVRGSVKVLYKYI